MDRGNKQTNVQADNTRCSVSVHGNIHGARAKQPHNYPKRNGSNKRNGHYKYLPTIIALLFASPVNAETVGGVLSTVVVPVTVDVTVFVSAKLGSAQTVATKTTANKNFFNLCPRTFLLVKY